MKKESTTLEIGFAHCSTEQFQVLMQIVYEVDKDCIGTLSKDEKTVTLYTDTTKADAIVAAIKDAGIFSGEVQ
jgi:hypothetical protein